MGKHQAWLHLVFFMAFKMSALWIWGITPPPAIVALINVSSSSSPLMANWRCLGVILLTLRSLLALPANSKTSAVRYSRIAAAYTAEVAPTLLLAFTLLFKNLWILPTGNYKLLLGLLYLEARSCRPWLGNFLWFSTAELATLSAFSTFACLHRLVKFALSFKSQSCFYLKQNKHMGSTNKTDS